MQLISGGFYVTRLLQKPDGLGDLLPDRLLTLSACLTQFLPDSWAFDWASDSDAERRTALGALGLAVELLPVIADAVNAALSAGDLGWPNVWHSARAAQKLLDKLSLASRDLMVIELAVPEDLVAPLCSAIAPAPGEGDPGLFTRLKHAAPPLEFAVPLGWELLGAERGASLHSWLCNSIQDDAFGRLGIAPGPFGLLHSDQEARQVLGLIATGIGAEPVPWFAGRLSRIS